MEINDFREIHHMGEAYTFMVSAGPRVQILRANLLDQETGQWVELFYRLGPDFESLMFYMDDEEQEVEDPEMRQAFRSAVRQVQDAGGFTSASLDPLVNVMAFVNAQVQNG